MADSPGDFAAKLGNMADSLAAEFDGTKDIPVRSLFTSEFMEANTRWSTIDAMMEEAGVLEVTEFPSEKWQNFILSQTSFPDWKTMVVEAYKVRVQSAISKNLS